MVTTTNSVFQFVSSFSRPKEKPTASDGGRAERRSPWLPKHNISKAPITFATDAECL